MHRFDDDDGEPVAVVRTLADFALALTLIVLMLIGTRSAVGSKPDAEVRGATAGKGRCLTRVQVLLQADGTFVGTTGAQASMDATALANQWHEPHPTTPATVVLQFSTGTLATDLHRALLNLQSAFGTNLTRIVTLPRP